MKKSHRQSRFLALIAAAAGLAPAAQTLAGDIYFLDILNFFDPDGNSIRKMTTDGFDLQTVVPAGMGLRGFDIDVAAGKMYWTDVDNFVIRRANLDGTGEEDVVTSGLAFPSALRIDNLAQVMYWGDQTNEEIWGAGLDSPAPFLLQPTAFNRGLAIDEGAGRIYWTTSVTATAGRIMRANIDGSEIMILRNETTSKPGSLAIDVARGRLYWVDPIAKIIRSSDLDGNDVQTVYQMPSFFTPRAVAIDHSNGQVFFSADLPQEEGPTTGDIYAMTLDGSGPYIVMSGLGVVNDMVIVSEGGGEPPCAADFDGNGEVQVPDIFAYLSAWFGNDPSADIDGTPGIGVPDIFAFLSLWFAGCD